MGDLQIKLLEELPACIEGNHTVACVRAEQPCDLAERPFRKARYSGPERSGVCICGHSWEDHHLGCIMRLERLWTDAGMPEYYVPQECEFYGCNEDGGLDAEGEPHCFGYKDGLDA